MKNIVFILLLAAAFLAVTAVQAQHGALHAPSRNRLANEGGEQQLAELIAKSSVIVEGRAENGYCFRDAANGHLYTATPIKVYKVFKGAVETSRLTVITRGGQVGNHAQASKSYVGLALNPTGMFFLLPATHSDPGAKTADQSTFEIVEEIFGFFPYEGIAPEADRTASRWQVYPHLETSLYPAVSQQVGHPHRVVRPFDVKQYDFVRERDIADSVAHRRYIKPARPSTHKALPRKLKSRP